MSELWGWGWVAGVVFGTDALLVYATWVACHQRHRAGQPACSQQGQGTAVEGVQAVREAVQTLTRSVERLHSRLGQLEQNQRVLPEVGEMNRKAVEVATRLAGTGADIAQIVSLCGVTEAEAELIQILQKGRSNSPELASRGERTAHG